MGNNVNEEIKQIIEYVNTVYVKLLNSNDPVIQQLNQALDKITDYCTLLDDRITELEQKINSFTKI